MSLQKFANHLYLQTHNYKNFSMEAVDLIDPSFQPRLLAEKRFLYDKYQLIEIREKEEDMTMYAIFYIETDGYMPATLDDYHYHEANNMQTYRTKSQDEAWKTFASLVEPSKQEQWQ